MRTPQLSGTFLRAALSGLALAVLSPTLSADVTSSTRPVR